MPNTPNGTAAIPGTTAANIAQYGLAVFFPSFLLLVALTKSPLCCKGTYTATTGELMNQTPFIRLRQYIPSLFAPLVLAAGIAGLVNDPFGASGETALQVYVITMLVVLGVLMVCVHLAMHLGRHKGKQFGHAAELGACTVMQCVFIGFYFAFRMGTKSKIGTTLAAHAAQLDVMLWLGDTACALVGSIMLYRLLFLLGVGGVVWCGGEGVNGDFRTTVGKDGDGEDVARKCFFDVFNFFYFRYDLRQVTVAAGLSVCLSVWLSVCLSGSLSASRSLALSGSV